MIPTPRSGSRISDAPSTSETFPSSTDIEVRIDDEVKFLAETEIIARAACVATKTTSHPCRDFADLVQIVADALRHCDGRRVFEWNRILRKRVSLTP